MATTYSDDEGFIDDDPDYQPPAQLSEEEQALEKQRADERAAIHKENLAILETVPDPVKKFIIRLHQAVSSQNVAEIANLYERGWNQLSNEFFKSEEWPRAEVVSSLVRDDDVFLILYRELYFRHLYSRFAANLDIDDRFDSYENYCTLFNYILNSEGPVPVELPISWLWDIIDEFLWQFGAFVAWRSKTKDKTADEIALLEESPQVWSCYSVLNVLYSLTQKSRVHDHLRAAKTNSEVEGADEYGSRPLYRMLGYFSILGLLRVHVLLGDYTLALSCLDEIDIKAMIGPSTRWHNVHAAHVAVFYYVGFSFIMLRRYGDAIDVLSRGVSHFYKNRRFTSGADQVAKNVERMLALIAIAHSFAPSTKLDDWVRQGIADKFGEASARINRGTSANAGLQQQVSEIMEVYEDLFTRASPKFISPNPPALHQEDGAGQIVDPLRHQLSIFTSDVKSLLDVPDMRSFLKLYSTLSTAKLASLLDRDEEDVVEELVVVKAASSTFRWNGEGSLLNGAQESVSDVNFTIDSDNIIISESKKQRQVAEYFLRRGNKAAEQVAQLRAKPLPSAPKSNNQSHYQSSFKSGNRDSGNKETPAKSVAWGTGTAART